MGHVFSQPMFAEGGVEDEGDDQEKDICYWASVGDEKQVKALLNRMESFSIHTLRIPQTPSSFVLLTNVPTASTVNWKDEEGRTPLMWACDRGHQDLVSLLLTSGADHSAHDSDGMTPLHYAAMYVLHKLITRSPIQIR
jgi:hypothetical protein